jgi:3-oxoacyl-[acyl-carrier protein] reductase
VGLLEGRGAVVTGAAQGLGYAIAERFVAEGASIVIADLDLDAARTAAEKLGSAVAASCDVTADGAVDAAVTACRKHFGHIDVMVNNAGFTRDRTMRKMSADDFRAVTDVHLLGAWQGIRAAGAAMREQGNGGSIITMSSSSGKVGNFGQTNYSAAKAGVIGLTKAAAKELAGQGTRVNALQPGLIDTAMTASMPQEAYERKLAEIPLGRAGRPDEVADVALFLASDLSSYVTGGVIEVTGGRYM